MDKSREKLPYRETTICFVIYKGKIISKIAGGGSYIKFPGGGVDKGESPQQAVVRELKEECGVSVKKLTFISELSAEWDLQWTENDPKRIERYKQFRGEKTYAFVAFLDKVSKPTSKEGDAWEGGVNKYLNTPKHLCQFIDKTLPKSHPNFKAFYKTQQAILRTIALFYSLK